MKLTPKELKHVILEECVKGWSLERGFSEKTIRDKRETLIRFLRFLKDKPFNANSVRSYFRSTPLLPPHKPQLLAGQRTGLRIWQPAPGRNHSTGD